MPCTLPGFFLFIGFLAYSSLMYFYYIIPIYKPPKIMYNVYKYYAINTPPAPSMKPYGPLMSCVKLRILKS